MGSRPSKVAPVRSRSGLSFVSTSSVASSSTIESTYETEIEGVKNFKFDEVTTKSFRVGWDPPKRFRAVSYQVRLFPPDKIKSRTLLRAHPQQRHTFTKLNSATEYSVAVVAIDGEGKKSSCETASVFTLPRPARNLQFTSTFTSTSVKAHWKHCKGKPGIYSIEVTEDGSNIPTAQEHDVTDNTRLFKGLTPGTEYIVTIWNVVRGRRSEPVSDRHMTAPRHVADITFSDVTQHEMTLKWRKPEGKAHSYTLLLSEHKKSTRSPVEIDNLTKTSYTFNGLTPGRLYKCKIVTKTLRKNGKIMSSKPQLFTQCTVPVEVAGISTRDIGPEEALVTWLRGNGDTDDYDLFLTPKEGVIGETTPRGVTKTNYKFTGLVPGTIYTIGIVANSKDKTSKRAISSFATVPGMIGDIKISDTQRSCTTQRIDWPSAAGRVDSYVVTIRREDKADEKQTFKDIFQTHHLLENLTPGTLYKVEVVVMRDGRESSSVEKIFGTVPAAVPSLSFVKDKSSWNKIFCTWGQSVGGVENYRITYKSKEEQKMEVITPSNKTDHLLTGLQPSKLYEVTIVALSNGLESFPVTVTQITGPGQVEDLEAFSPSKREIRTSWNPPPHGVEQYLLTLKSLEERSDEIDISYSTAECCHTFSNLVPGSSYQISVIPVSGLVPGKMSVTEAHTKPGDVQNIHVPEDKVTCDSIYVKWWGVEGNEDNVDVTLTRLKNGDDVKTDFEPLVVTEEHVEGKQDGLNEVTFSGLDPNMTYGIRLRAVGKSGNGNDAVFTQTTQALPTVTREEETPPSPEIINPPSDEEVERSENARAESPKERSLIDEESQPDDKVEVKDTDSAINENPPLEDTNKYDATDANLSPQLSENEDIQLLPGTIENKPTTQNPSEITETTLPSNNDSAKIETVVSAELDSNSSCIDTDSPTNNKEEDEAGNDGDRAATQDSNSDQISTSVDKENLPTSNESDEKPAEKFEEMQNSSGPDSNSTEHAANSDDLFLASDNNGKGVGEPRENSEEAMKLDKNIKPVLIISGKQESLVSNGKQHEPNSSEEAADETGSPVVEKKNELSFLASLASSD